MVPEYGSSTYKLPSPAEKVASRKLYFSHPSKNAACMNSADGPRRRLGSSDVLLPEHLLVSS